MCEGSWQPKPGWPARCRLLSAACVHVLQPQYYAIPADDYQCKIGLGRSGGPTLSGGHEPAIVPQLADLAHEQPHLMGGMGQAGQSESAASQRYHSLREHRSRSQLWSLCSWTACQPLGQLTFVDHHRSPHTWLPGDSRVFCPDAEGHPHLHGDTDSGPPACTSTARGWPAASSPCRLTPSPCHGLGPHQALASSPHGTSGTCCRRDSDSGTAPRVSSQPSPRRCLVSWHHRPQILGLRQPAHESSGHEPAACARCDIIAGVPDAVSSMRPAIWPAEYGGEHSGIRRLESRWAAAWDHRQQLQPQPDAPGPSRIRGAPDPSTDAPWAHGSQPRPAPVQTPTAAISCSTSPADRAYAETARACHAALRSDDIDIATLAAGRPSSSEWAHTWRAAQ